MLDFITQFIDKKVYNNRNFLQQFTLIAETITKEYIEATVQKVVQNETDLSMNEIMYKVEVLNKELKLKAAWCKDTYREDVGRTSMYLGRNCNKIIKMCVTQYIRQVTTVNKIQKALDVNNTADVAFTF